MGLFRSRFRIVQALFSLLSSKIMGRVRTKTVKKAAKVIIEKYYTKLTLDFDINKKIIEEIALIPSKPLQQDRRLCHSPHEEAPEVNSPWNFHQAARGRTREEGQLRSRRVRAGKDPGHRFGDQGDVEVYGHEQPRSFGCSQRQWKIRKSLNSDTYLFISLKSRT